MRVRTIFFSLILPLAIILVSAGVVWGQVNYTLTPSNAGSFTPLSGASAFTWTTTIANDDEYSTAVNIFAAGETFTYAGTGFTQFQVSTNGFIRLGADLASATPADAMTGTLRSIIAPLWDDLAVSATATDVTYKIDGTTPNQVLTVEWRNVKWNKTAVAANAEFQVKLYETSNVIQFVYGTMGAPTAGSASIGLVDNTTITAVGSAVGKFLSVNVGGVALARVYHQTMGLPFNTVNNAHDNFAVLTFTPTVPAALSGTYTVGGSSPNYQTLSQAAMALNINGVSGPVTLNVRAGTYDDVFHLLPVAGASAANSITLRPEGGAGTVTIAPHNGSYATSGPGTTSGDAIIRLDGAQYVTIDGLVLTDNGDNATTATKFDVGVLLATSHLNGAITSGARFNTVKNCTIDMRVNSGIVNSGATCVRTGTYNSTETDTGKANSYNTIQNVTLTGFWRSGIRFFGISRTNPDRGNIITAIAGRNTVGNVAITTGSSLDMRVIEFDCQNNFTFEKTDIVNITNAVNTTNNIYVIVVGLGSTTRQNSASGGLIRISDVQIANVSMTAAGVTTGSVMAIFSTQDVDDGYEIQVSGCRVLNLSNSATTTGTVRGIVIAPDSATGKTAKVFNNFIYDLRAPASTGTPGVRGIDIQGNTSAGAFPIVANVYNNTVYLDNATVPTNAGHRSAGIYWGNFSTSTIDLRNNIVVNTMSTTTGFSPALYPSANSNMLRLAPTTDNNLLWVGTTSTNKPLVFDGVNSYTTLAAYQTAVASGGLGGPREVNSIAADITTGFVSAVSPYDLHIASSSWIVNGQAKPTTLVGADIDGDARSTDVAVGPCDIGADEYTPAGSAPTTQVGAITDGGTTTFTGVDNKTIAVISWFAGTGTLPTSVTMTYTPGAQAVSPSIFRKFTITGSGGSAGWNADLSLYYNSSTELRGFAEASMRINQDPGTGYVVLPTFINTTTHNGVTNVTSLSDFSFDNGTNPLPIQLASLTATQSGSSVRVAWRTLSELNNYGFEVQRSEGNESNYQTIPNSFVRGQGTTNEPHDYEFTDNTVSNGTWYYRLKQIDLDRSVHYSDGVRVSVLTGVGGTAPREFALHQNYPNPFNPATTIKFTVETADLTTLVVYNSLGQSVATLFDGLAEPGHFYTVRFDGSNLASGVYFYRLTSGKKSDLKKLVLLK